MAIVPCAPITPIRGVVVFEPGVFKTQYPAFATVADAALLMNFDLATIQLNNSCGSRVCAANIRESLLNLLTAHITALLNGANGAAPSGIVGRVNQATEGSVSVGADMGAVVYGEAYYLQTQWGALYWQSTAAWRQAVYIAPPTRCYDGYGFGPWGGGNGFNGGDGCGC